MKPTSIIFIILAAILIVVGIIICAIGGFTAGADDNVQLLCDKVDEDKNDITTHSLTEFDVTDIDIDMKNVDVNIIGQSVESYIEFKNVNSATYNFVINDHKMTLDTVNPFDISSMVKFRENEGGFNGLRQYLFLNKYKKAVSEVNIYVMPGQDLSSIRINVEGGNINVKNMIADADYELNAAASGSVDGNVVFENTNTDGTLTVNVKNANFTFNSSSVKSLDFVVENGYGKFTLSKQYNISCQCESGKIFLDNENVGDSYVGPYPQKETVEGEEVVVPDQIRGKIISGDLEINTAE